VPQQFENEDNPRIHYETTAVELWNQLDGKIDVFVSGLGSGGTLQGIGRFLKEKNPDIKIVAVEPKNVSALLGHEPGLHRIQGIGDGFIPAVLDVGLIDEIIEVTDDDAMATARALAREQGVLAGTTFSRHISSKLMKRGELTCGEFEFTDVIEISDLVVWWLFYCRQQLLLSAVLVCCVRPQAVARRMRIRLI
jgi:cysteine synthase